MGNPAKLNEAVRLAIRKVVGNSSVDVPLHQPFIDDSDRDVARMSDPVGYDFIKMFEGELAEVCGVKHAVAVSSGTAALHLALLACDVVDGDYVGMPSLTFVAAAAATLYCGATPYFGGNRPPSRAKAPSIKARIVLDLLGHIDVNATRGGPVPVIEDAAAALGSKLNGKPAGSFGDIGVLSFNNNKIITTGGGGAVLTDDVDIAMKVRHLATTAKVPSPFFFEHNAVGYNYRMSNMAAALGYSQLLRLPMILDAKRETYEEYAAAFSGIDEVNVWEPMNSTDQPNFWLNALGWLIEDDPWDRNGLLEYLAADGLGVRALYTPLHLQKPYASFPATDAARRNSESLFAETICLPSGRRI